MTSFEMLSGIGIIDNKAKHSYSWLDFNLKRNLRGNYGINVISFFSCGF